MLTVSTGIQVNLKTSPKSWRNIDSRSCECLSLGLLLCFFDAFMLCWLKVFSLCHAGNPLECSLLNLQCSSSTVSPCLVPVLSIGCEKVLQLPSTWLHRTLLQLACLCQALHLVSLESLRRNHTRLSQPPCRTTSVTMFALRTQRFIAHFKVIVVSVSTRMSGVRSIRERVRYRVSW